MIVVNGIAVAAVFIGTVPIFVGTYQILLACLHRLRNHYGRCAPYYPRTVIIIPAWNEGAVVGASVDRLMRLDYPPDALRVYVVDDASTDDTPDIVREKERLYPGRAFHLRREQGGQGKAHTLNHGLAVALADSWMQALLIMDADVIYSASSLRRMTRHLADPTVGAVTAYIREGTRPGNFMNRFIGFEYVTAQAAARRGQNVLGVLACLAGGAQLHSRENLEALGGRIDTTSLAEDTFTTFNTQLAGRRVVFDPHATVLSEEPGSVVALWKQRVRWARGNVQVTRRYGRVWFRAGRYHGLGGISFGLIWFGLFLQPFLMIASSAGLVWLYFANPGLASTAFALLWISTALTFVTITTVTLLIDPETGRHCWREAIAFPGLVSLTLMVYAIFPNQVRHGVDVVAGRAGFALTERGLSVLVLAIYLWPAASMLLAALAKWAEQKARLGVVNVSWLAAVLVYLIGYGPLLCAMSLAAYVKELRGAEMAWEKTEKTGTVLG